MREFTVNFVAKDPWRLVVLEEGPWNQAGEVLRNNQENLYSCVDTIIDVQFSERHPESIGQEITVQLDYYNSPPIEETHVFFRFTTGLLSMEGYSQGIETNSYVSLIKFLINCDESG